VWVRPLDFLSQRAMKSASLKHSVVAVSRPSHNLAQELLRESIIQTGISS
jgi:hypothetical protein